MSIAIANFRDKSGAPRMHGICLNAGFSVHHPPSYLFATGFTLSMATMQILVRFT